MVRLWEIGMMELSIPGELNPEDFEVVPLHNIESALGAYRAAGGVVDYGVLWFASTVEADQARRVAIATMVDQRLTDYANAIGSKRAIRDCTDVSRATSELITAEEFVGPHYDWASGRLRSPWSDGFRVGAAPHGFITHGYADAFSDPPYSLQAPIEKVSAWFEAINFSTFGGLDHDLVVYRWSTDWSECFDPGHEWWGAYCWTVQQVGS
jgi:hypothetical protein